MRRSYRSSGSMELSNSLESEWIADGLHRSGPPRNSVVDRKRQGAVATPRRFDSCLRTALQRPQVLEQARLVDVRPKDPKQLDTKRFELEWILPWSRGSRRTSRE